MTRGKENVRRDFYRRVVRMADAGSLRVASEQAGEMWSRILRSFAGRPDGGQLADALVAVINYFSQIGYWRGYRNAKRHYKTLGAARRAPRGRKGVHLAIEDMLEKDLGMSAEDICEGLDEAGLSDSFYLGKGEKGRTINVGPRVGKGKVDPLASAIGYHPTASSV